MRLLGFFEWGLIVLSWAFEAREGGGIGALSAHMSASRTNVSRVGDAFHLLRKLRREQIQTGRRADCQGLVSELCTSPCETYSGSKAVCDAVQKECSVTFCDPLCLSRKIWTCSIKFPKGMPIEGADPRYGDALCAQLIAEGCATTLKCCDDKSLLRLWRQNEAHKFYGEIDVFPAPSCEHNASDLDAADAACTRCKGVSVKLSVPSDACDKEYFHDPSAYPFPPALSGTGAFDEEARAALRVPVAPGTTDLRHAMWNRCTRLAEKIAGSLDTMATSFKEKMCTCMGCCGDAAVECFRPEPDAPLSLAAAFLKGFKV